MDKPLVFLIVVGVVAVLLINYSGTSFFSFSRGPLATGPGGGTDIESPRSANGKSGFGFAPGSRTDKKPEPGQSPFYGQVRISSVRAEELPDKEYVLLRHGGYFSSAGDKKQPIVLDGWTIENVSGNRLVIPKAVALPGSDTSASSIKLAEGDEIILVSGRSTYGSSFRENICTGYFAEFHSFTPPLSESCPEFSRDEIFKAGLNSACVEVIDNTLRCRQARIGFEESAAGNECVAFAGAHLNYAGCLRDNRGKPDFLSPRWRAFLNRGETIWNPKHDRIILRDKDGLMVDEYSY